MADSCILAIDQGTSGSRAVLVDAAGQIVADAYEEFPQILPQPGWVEHDPCAILRSVAGVMGRAVGGRWDRIAAIGLTNQRETTVLWERQSGRPLANAIVWQDRRTAPRCLELAAHAPLIQRKTGLLIDAYFSATKLEWLLNHAAHGRQRAIRGDLCFGTIDSWLAWNLTGGRAHVTDFTNASRTMLFNIHERCWDPELLELFGIPAAVLPQVCASSQAIARTDPASTGGRAIAITSIAGDQQAALFAQGGWQAGLAKNTYGTGAFLLMNVGRRPIASDHRLLLTLTPDAAGQPSYALEGSVFIAGAAIQWLRDQMGVLTSAAESEHLARSLSDNGGVYFIPALAGLGAPHWQPEARGAIFGLTRGSGRAHLARAALEAMAYQTRQVIEAMQHDSGLMVRQLATDGGASRNDWLMQFQADVLGVPVARAANVEMTALGAAYLAGLAVGLWPGADGLPADPRTRTFTPSGGTAAQEGYRAWSDCLRKLLA